MNRELTRYCPHCCKRTSREITGQRLGPDLVGLLCLECGIVEPYLRCDLPDVPVPLLARASANPAAGIRLSAPP